MWSVGESWGTDSNARIEADKKTLADQEATETESASILAVKKVRKRHAAIAKACTEAGMPEHAIPYFDDARELSEILDEIRSVQLVQDYASHLGVKSEFKQTN